MTCIRLVDSNDLPQLFSGANSTVDTIVVYQEGQPEPLILAPELEIRGEPTKPCSKLNIPFSSLPPPDRDGASLSSAIILFPGLSPVQETITITNPLDLTITSLPNQILISANPSASLSAFTQVLRSVTYSTSRPLR